MSKSPTTPNTPSTSKRGSFRMFSRQNLKKDNTLGAVPIHISVPQSTTQFGFSSRNKLTYSNNLAGQKAPPKLRVNVQLDRAPNPQTRTSVLEKFPSPSAVSTRTPRHASPSTQSWHNLHEKKVQTKPHNGHFTVQKPSESRHKRHLGGPEDLQMYLQNIAQSTPAFDVRPPINASPDNFTRDIDVDKDLPVLSSSSSCSSDDDESIHLTTSDIALDDYPWYFVEAVGDDANLLYGLSPLPFHHFEALKGKYIFEV